MQKRTRRQLQYILVRLIVLFIQAVPRDWALWACQGLSRAAWALLPRERAKALFNLRLIFPQRDDHVALGREVFRMLALNGVDALRLPVMSAAQINELVTVDGLDYFDAAYRQGKGLIAITGHIGCWELIPAWFSLHGYNIGVVGKRVYDDRLDDLLSALRARHGVVTFDRETGAKQILRHLLRGGGVGILIDQDTRVASVDAEFLGHAAKTPSGAAAFADKLGCPVLPLAIHRQQDGRHVITVLPPLEAVDEKDKEARLVKLVQQQTTKIEQLVQMDITQWVWMHLRWKEKPGAL
jgi:Kdo2-lipid IVA lauroyltransferase/acyltransferase